MKLKKLLKKQRKNLVLTGKKNLAHFVQKSSEQNSGDKMTKTEQWLEERRGCIGASDVAAILGFSPFKTRLDVFLEKTQGSKQSENESMLLGRDFEQPIANAYERNAKRAVKDLGATTIQYHPKYKFLGATLDRMTSGSAENPGPADGPAPLELKAVNGFQYNVDSWKEDPPVHYQIQLQMQMACTSTKWGSLCALIGGVDLVWRDFERDNDLIDCAIPILKSFWYDNVLKGIPPEPEGKPEELNALKRIYPADIGETIALNHESLSLVQEMNQAKAAAKEAEKKAKGIEAKLRGILKNATFGALPDGTFLTLKTTRRAGYTKTFEPSEYRVLRHSKKK